MEIKSQIKLLLNELNEGVYEKEEVTALALLTAIAGESIFLLGAPGVAKSLVARRLKFAFKEGTSFEYLMNRFSTPDEIFGPVSISKLKDEDKYERIIKNYLPTATVVFLDEIWKAGPSIQNSLLTVLNEKIYRNGDTEVHVPMKALIAASNELPLKGEGLEALWDRFLVRYIVGGIEDRNNFNEMISKTLRNYEDNISAANKINDKLYNTISDQIENVTIPKDIFNVIHVIRKHIEGYNNSEDIKDKEPIYISDRRWRKIIRLMRTSAFLNGRTNVDMMDCFLITHCIWHESEQYKVVNEIVKNAIQEYGYILNMNLPDIQEELAEFNEDVVEGCKFKKQVNYQEPETFYTKFYKIVGFSFSFTFNGTFDLILKSEFKKLRKDAQVVNIHCDSGNSATMEKPKRFEFSKGNHEDTLFYQDDEYTIKLADCVRTETFTKKPNAEQVSKWTKRLKVILTTTTDLKKQVTHFREKDVVQLRENMFVNTSHADTVDENLVNTNKEIEKLEVEANRIKHYWEQVEDQEGIDFNS